jgi:hypothetical protein
MLKQFLAKRVYQWNVGLGKLVFIIIFTNVSGISWQQEKSQDIYMELTNETPYLP